MTNSRFSIMALMMLLAFCFLFTIPSCKELVSKDSIKAEFSYSNHTLALTIKNNSEKAVYIQTKAFDNIEIYYKGKLVDDPNILYDPSDLGKIPEPPIPDSTIKTQVTWEMPFINVNENRNADSSALITHLFSEYKKLNNLKFLCNQDSVRIISFINMYSLTIGELLFLKPHESFSFYKTYSCFKKMPGDYRAKCDDLSINITHLPSYVEWDNFKIPIVLPIEIYGYRRFDGHIKCNYFTFSTFDYKL
jgi:hypothetical protein